MAEVRTPDVPTNDKVALSPESTALIVVDMQNDFAHPDGALFCEEAPGTFEAISNLLGRARDAGCMVVYTQDWHNQDDPEFAIWGEHARADTWGSEIVDELKPRDDDVVIQKLRYDAFYGTPLDHRLRSRGIESVIVTGTVANICVLHTAGSAALRWYDVVVPEDGISAITPFDKASALRQVTFLYAGKVTTSDGIRLA